MLELETPWGDEDEGEAPYRDDDEDDSVVDEDDDDEDEEPLQA